MKFISEETREKIRQTRLGKKWSLEMRLKFSIVHKGLMSGMKGKKHTAEAKEKNRLAHLGKLGYWLGKKRPDIAEQQRKRFKEGIGNLSLNWIDGRTPLALRIRHLEESKLWRESVFKRDVYTCKECNNHNGNGKRVIIEAHHKKPFRILLQEFLKEYDQFSPMEDKETLVRLAMKYEPFWDINNGITLCKKCHNETKLTRIKWKKPIGQC